MTYNTAPLINSASLGSQAFDSLQQAQPALGRLIMLVLNNGVLIDHSHQHPNPTQQQVLEIEAKISDVSARASKFGPDRPLVASFREAYEPLARVHMMW
jgi:hypothetical protein